MADPGFYCSSSFKTISKFNFTVAAQLFRECFGCLDHSLPNLLNAPVSAINKSFFKYMPGQSLLLLQGCIQCMAVVFILGQVKRADDHPAVLGNGN